LNPARWGVYDALLAPGLRNRTQVVVEEHRLHGGGALVDAEQQGHDPRCSAVRRHHGPAAVGGGPGRSGSSEPSRRPRSATIEQTRSAIPSEALSPVERIAATFTRQSQDREGPIK